MTSLQELYLNDNELSGAIPADLGDLADLEMLSLQRNLLSGALPAALGGLTSLQELYLHDNSLSGPIPAELANLTHLEALNILDTTLCVPVANADLQTWTATIDDFQGENTCPWNFLANANYRVFTAYGSTTEIELADYLDPELTGTTSVTFTLASCDSSRADYYDTVSVNSGKAGSGIQYARAPSWNKHSDRHRLHRHGDGWGHNQRPGIPPLHRFGPHSTSAGLRCAERGGCARYRSRYSDNDICLRKLCPVGLEKVRWPDDFPCRIARK